MKTTIYTLAATLAFFASACSAEDKALVLSENFEDIANSEFFANAEFRGEVISEATGKDAIGGKGTSLVLDTTKDNSQWPCAITFPKNNFEPSCAYEITFDYKVLQGNRDGSVQNFILIDAKLNGKNIRVTTQTFGEKVGEVGKITCIGRIPGKASGAKASITSSKGSKIAIDNLKIRRFETPPESEWMFEPDAFVGMRFLPTDANFMDYNQPFAKMSKEQFFPFIDKYGQFKHKEWKNKIHSDEELIKQKEEEAKFNSKHPPLKNRDEFFGLIDDEHKYEATGKFRVQKIDGKWFFITPKGNLFWSLGIDSVGNYPGTPITDRENYFEDISDKKYVGTGWWGKFFYDRKHQNYNFGRRNADKKYGCNADDVYGKVAAERMGAWGLNTYGAWTNKAVLQNQIVPYAFITNSVKPTKLESKEELNAYWIPFPDYFDPQFEIQTKSNISKSAAFIDSPYCVGVFVDNELPWQAKDYLTARAVLTCGPKQFSKIAFKDMLVKKYGDIAKLNKAWESNYASWKDMLTKDDFIPKSQEGLADMLAFERKLYEHYYTICRDAVKACSKDTLYFGCRLAWTNATCGIVASEICDVVSYNLYRNNVDGYALPEGSQDKPIIIGEYHFGNQDRGVFGGGLRPRKTMDEKVKSYEIYTISALNNPNVVGAHWFEWFDEATSSRSDGENYSIGFVDICDTPSYEMAKAARKISKNMYNLRLNSKGAQEVNKEKTTVY